MISDAEMVKAGIDSVLAPVRDTLNRLLGPLADELGGVLADPVRVFRFKRSVRLLEKVKRIAEEAGFEPRAVPLKTLLPILENASLEEDEDLHDRWANLLARAADPRADAIPPSLPRILSEMSSREARFLDRLHSYLSEMKRVSPETLPLMLTKPMHRGELFDQYIKDSEFDPEAFNVDVDSLLRFRLLSVEAAPIDAEAIRHNEPLAEDDIYRLTSLGLLFVTACKAKES